MVHTSHFTGDDEGVFEALLGSLLHVTRFDWAGLDDPGTEAHPVRPNSSFSTWQENRDLVVSAGHNWCSIIKDKW